ncbi:uncharacterized protein LOC111916698 [Lactuca sativa]|uniref:uncharacterized protein LOC111916698 n=1 Tax=Lactuca sativa TaxID=4236 RepID=UPI000CD9EE2B|nr:uncharacterized protein LOC111916698 [Lactuca sativa]
MCPLCSVAVETIDHLFVGCRELLEIWSRIPIWWDVRLPDRFAIDDIMRWVDSTSLKIGQRKAFDAVIISAFWCLWNFRNNFVFGPTIPRKSDLFDAIVERTFFWISNRSSKSRIGWTSWLHNPVLASILM